MSERFRLSSEMSSDRVALTVLEFARAGVIHGLWRVHVHKYKSEATVSKLIDHSGSVQFGLYSMKTVISVVKI